MKAAEIKELSNADIEEKIEDMQAAQEKLLLTHNVSQLENPMQLRENRRIIARLHTELTTRKAAGAAGAATSKKVEAAPAKEATTTETETKDEEATTEA